MKSYNYEIRGIILLDILIDVINKYIIKSDYI